MTTSPVTGQPLLSNQTCSLAYIIVDLVSRVAKRRTYHPSSILRVPLDLYFTGVALPLGFTHLTNALLRRLGSMPASTLGMPDIPNSCSSWICNHLTRNGTTYRWDEATSPWNLLFSPFSLSGRLGPPLCPFLTSSITLETVAALIGVW